MSPTPTPDQSKEESRSDNLTKLAGDDEDLRDINIKPEEVLKKIGEEKILGTALIDKTGKMIDSDLPSYIRKKTFSKMCATIVGAACHVNLRLTGGDMKKSIIYLKKANLILDTIDGVIFVLIVKKDADAKVLSNKLNEAIRDI